MRRDALTMALVVAVLGTAVSAAPAQSAVPRPPGGMVDDYSDRHGVSRAEAERRLTVQRRAFDIVEALQARLGERYAGVWFDNRVGRVRIGAIPGTDASEARAPAEQRGVGPDTDVVAVDFTWDELLASQRQVDRELEDLIRAQKLQTGIETNRNAVVLSISTAATAAEQQRVADVARRTPATVVRERPAPEFYVSPQQCGFPHCNRPLRGGVEIAHFASGTVCTAGFLARTASHRYMMTAGHCAARGGDWWAHHHTTATWNVIGPVQNWVYDFNGDAGIIRATNGFWDISPWRPVSVYWWFGIEMHPTHGRGWSWVGLNTCHAGRTSATTCGNVEVVNQTIQYSDGTWHGGMVQVGACGDPGDSGGPVMSGNIAYGLWSAGYGCNVLNRGHYMEVLHAENYFGVTVVTE